MNYYKIRRWQRRLGDVDTNVIEWGCKAINYDDNCNEDPLNGVVETFEFRDFNHN